MVLQRKKLVLSLEDLLEEFSTFPAASSFLSVGIAKISFSHHVFAAPRAED